jgi:peptidoglycan/LPS O-acetylase OafA/YrhL
MDTIERFAKGQIPSLNGWRAVAILLVLLDHSVYTVGFPIDDIPAWGWVILQPGNLGVRIFFVLSGFLITHLLLREAESSDSISLKNFFVRRCLRILPVYIVYLGVLAFLLKAGIYFGEDSSSWLGALTFTRNMIGPASSYTGHFWSLAVEEQFYLLWPFLLLTFRLWRRPRLAYLLLLMPVILCPLIRMSGFSVEKNGEFYGRVLGTNSILVYADSLAVGCLGAFLLRRVTLRLTSVASSMVLVLALTVIVAGAVLGLMTRMKGGIILAFVPSCQAFAILIAMWISTQRPKSITFRLLNSPPMNFLGVLSYSLYIWHVLFLCDIIEPPLRAVLYNWRTWWLAAIVMAAVSYYGVERPVLRLKNKLTPK